MPQFNGYVITITGSLNGKPGEWTFFGASGVDQPTYLPKKPIPKQALLMCVAHELRQPPRSNSAQLFLRVRNLGAVPAYDASCIVGVIGRGGRKAGTAKSILKGAKDGRDGIVAGGEERLFVIGFRSFPLYEGYDVSLDWKAPPAEERLSGGEFEGKQEVELAHFGFEKKGEDVIVSGDARNGLGSAIAKLEITVTLFDGRLVAGRATALLKGPIGPGKILPFKAVGRNIGNYNDFSYAVSFDEAGKGPEPVVAGNAVVTIEKAVRKPDGTVLIGGNIKNAGAMAIKDVDIVLSFRKTEGGAQKVVKSVTHRAPGVLEPGAASAFEVEAKKVPDFDDYFYEVTYKPAGPK